MFPPLNSALLARRAFGFDWAQPANACPIIAQFPTVFLIRVVIGLPIAGWAQVGVLVGMINEIGFVEPAYSGGIGRACLSA